MKSKPIEIDERMSRKIAGLGFICACMVVGLHVHMDVAHMTQGAVNFQYTIRRIFGMAVPLFFIFRAFFLRGIWARVDGGCARAENGYEALLFRTCFGTFLIWFFSCHWDPWQHGLG